MFAKYKKSKKYSLNIKHLRTLTDQKGIIQHAKYQAPDIQHGYALDDNARALIAATSLKEKLLQDIYLSFVKRAQKEDGKFHTFADQTGLWVDHPGRGDSLGKAFWALCFYHVHSKNSVFSLIRKSLPQIPNTTDLRTKAFCILGLCQLSGSKYDNLLITLADDLEIAYKNTRDQDWYWFENSMTYENARLPQALLSAYIATGKGKYKKIALETLNFLLKNIYNRAGFFDFIGQNGWLRKGKQKAIFDQQPVEAGGIIETLTLAYRITQDKGYMRLAQDAQDWYHGKNRNKIALYDKKTNGVKDGLTPDGVNENQGAESILSYLLANLSLENRK